MSDYANASWPYWALGVLLLGGLLWALPPSAEHPVEAEIFEAVPVPLRRPYLAKAAHTWVSIGTFPNGYVGHDLYNKADERIGMINDILIGPDGKMTAAIIAVSWCLGIGDKHVLVPISALQLELGPTVAASCGCDERSLQAAPAFEEGQASKRDP
jgi:hypothetical protein